MGADRASAFHPAELSGEGDGATSLADSEALILFGHADPIGEPVAVHGPFVMNTRADIDAAIRDYQAGRFGAEP